MSQLIEAEYDEFLKDVQYKLQKISPDLAMQAMYYERKFTDVEPRGEITIEYNTQVDLERKRFELGKKYGFEMASKGPYELIVVGLMTLSTIYEISKDQDIRWMSGTISCAS